MHIEVSCRHGELSGGTRDYIVRKVEKLIHYFERVTQIDVVVDFEGTIHKGSGAAPNPSNNGHVNHDKRVKVEISVDAEHKHDFVASDTGEDVGMVFDATLHKMEQQIRRYKEKIQNHRRDTPMSRPAEPLATADE